MYLERVVIRNKKPHADKAWDSPSAYAEGNEEYVVQRNENSRTNKRCKDTNLKQLPQGFKDPYYAHYLIW